MSVRSCYSQKSAHLPCLVISNADKKTYQNKIHSSTNFHLFYRLKDTAKSLTCFYQTLSRLSGSLRGTRKGSRAGCINPRATRCFRTSSQILHPHLHNSPSPISAGATTATPPLVHCSDALSLVAYFRLMFLQYNQ